MKDARPGTFTALKSWEPTNTGYLLGNTQVLSIYQPYIYPGEYLSIYTYTIDNQFLSLHKKMDSFW